MTHSQWAAAHNPMLEENQYPLPKRVGLFSTLAVFQDAHQQMSLEEQSQELVTINMHKCLYCMRLPFGVASVPAIIQKTMDMIWSCKGFSRSSATLTIYWFGSVQEVWDSSQTLNPLHWALSGCHWVTHHPEQGWRAPQPCNVQELHSSWGWYITMGNSSPTCLPTQPSQKWPQVSLDAQCTKALQAAYRNWLVF